MRVKLGDVCEILNGYAFKSDQYVSSGIRIIRIANVQKGYLEDSDPAFYPKDTAGLNKYMLKRGDLLMSLTGNVGRVALLEEKFLPAALNQRVACLRIKRSDVLLEYVFHVLNSNLFEQRAISLAKGVAQKNMSAEWLKEYEIPVVSLEKQRYIIDLLNNTYAVIKSRRQQLTELDKLVKARFVEMFGYLNEDSFVTIKDVCSIITDGTHQPPKFVNEGIPFIFVSNLANNEITYEAEKFITEETYNELIKRTPIEIGDVLLSTVGSYGHPAVVKSSKRFLFQRHIAYLKPNHNIINSEYLKSALLSSNGQRQIEEKVKGIAQKTLNLSDIRSIMIPLPPIDLQNEFAVFVEQVDKSKVIKKNRLIHFLMLHRRIFYEHPILRHDV